jgi:hypothetical protein
LGSGTVIITTLSSTRERAFHWSHEPAWYAVRGTGHWCGDRRQTTVWDLPNLNPLGEERTDDNRNVSSVSLTLHAARS